MSPSESTETLLERIAFLEAALAEREQDLSVFRTIVGQWAEARILGDPLEEFFAHPEDWEIFIPVDPSVECHRECGREFRAAVAKCQLLGTKAERLACVRKADDYKRRCAQSCG